jgi:CelD/BcsL family acetyltransferase involved in cellulose biosynthesis
MSEPFRVRLLEKDEELVSGPGSTSPLKKAGELFVHEDVAALEALDELEPAWRRLLAPEASPFQTFAWNHAWYRTYALGRVRPLLFEWRRGGETVAILPCYREGKTIRLAADRICDYQDVIARDGDEVAALLAAVLEWVAMQGHGGQCRFEKLSSRGLLFHHLHAAGGLPDHSLCFEKSYAPCPYADLRGGLENYLGGLPRKLRQDFRHSLNRLEREAADARVTILRDFDIRVDDLWNAAAFHVEHFRKDGESPFADHRLIDLFGRVAKDPESGFQLAFLTLYGDLLAVDFGFVRGGCYYGYLTAFDAGFGRLAPGKCLLLKRIDRWVAEDSVHTLDFLAGDEEYKRSFTGNAAYHVWSLRLMPDDFHNRLRRAGLESDKQLRQFAKRALGREEGLPR